MTIRNLTISEAADTYRMRHGRETTKPTIRLQGNWLDRAGFSVGMTARVTVSEGRLIIEPTEGRPE